MLEFDLPVYTPTDLSFGAQHARVRYARAVPNLPAGPGEESRPGIEVQMGGDWLDGRRVVRPGPVLVDGVHLGYTVTPREEPGLVSVNIPMDDPSSARRITMSKPIIVVRGPWEIPFLVP